MKVILNIDEEAGLSRRQRQDPGRQWIQRAEVTDLTEAHLAPNGFDHVMRRAALWLIDDEDSVDRAL